MNEWMNDCMSECIYECMKWLHAHMHGMKRMNDRMHGWTYESMNECTERMKWIELNDYMRELMNEWMDEWMNEWMHVMNDINAWMAWINQWIELIHKWLHEMTEIN